MKFFESNVIRIVGPAVLLSAAALLLAPVAEAAVFTVQLTNGTEIETRYRPSQSAEDENKILLLTEHGNWITLPKEYVTAIVSDFEARGFGTVLDSTTIFLGYSPNDAPAPGEQPELDGTDRLIQYLQGRDQPAPSYSVPQFVEPNSSGGIPLSFGGRTTPPIGGEPTVVGSGR